ncbi:hypothetical protein TIFTF001_003237 [Ficus carica]|uniref:Uncharacterized protein n=1 Tax=Ficus carica TaxID=3494 RepID=A0AA87ZE74_FICCA|nr:hypothetical protein TIFTF001_003237 [Ficus carica]
MIPSAKPDTVIIPPSIPMTWQQRWTSLWGPHGWGPPTLSLSSFCLSSFSLSIRPETEERETVSVGGKKRLHQSGHLPPLQPATKPPLKVTAV